MAKRILIAADAVAFAGKGRIAGEQRNLPVPVFQERFCDGIYGAVIVKTEEIHIHVVGAPFQKNGGNSEVSDAVYKKVRVLWLTGDEDQSGNILADEIFDFFALNIRQAVGKGNVDGVALSLQARRDPFENLCVVDVVNVCKHHADPVGACERRSLAEALGMYFSFSMESIILERVSGFT